jgi:hypothetical protein
MHSPMMVVFGRRLALTARFKRIEDALRAPKMKNADVCRRPSSLETVVVSYMAPLAMRLILMSL